VIIKLYHSRHRFITLICHFPMECIDVTLGGAKLCMKVLFASQRRTRVVAWKLTGYYGSNDQNLSSSLIKIWTLKATRVDYTLANSRSRFTPDLNAPPRVIWEEQKSKPIFKRTKSLRLVTHVFFFALWWCSLCMPALVHCAANNRYICWTSSSVLCSQIS
jgi:hypothetical protein